MPTSQTSRNEIIPTIVKVFRQYGYDGTTLGRLSEVTGLGRASLYHHFPRGKKEMGAAVLNHMNDWLENSVLSPLRSGGTPHERLRDMSTNLNKFYSCGEDACLLAVLSLGESRDLFNAQIRQALNVWIDSLAEVLVDAGFKPKCARHRAEDAIMQIQGALVLARGLSDTTFFERVLQRLPEELLKA
ncbi:MAG: TetR/AcrR family transcriptional regulator [Cyanobacteria bacterium QH_9_48_43]|jgi:AcrR family transcriptional regulator|nr:MAG: TetR/AcrR family transcriptional regulator [Cyanobacteria bacterium QH_9_48_43]